MATRKPWEPRGRGRAGRTGRCLVFPLGAKRPGLFGCWAAGGFGVGQARDLCAPGIAPAPGWSGQRIWAGLRSSLAPPGFSPHRPPPSAPALWPHKSRDLVERERLPHTLLSPTQPSRVPRWQGMHPDTSFPTVGGNEPRVRSGLILGGALGLPSSMFVCQRATHVRIPGPNLRDKGLSLITENYSFPCIKTVTLLGLLG